MGHYRKVEVTIWNDEKFRALSDRAKLAFIFLLSHPSMTSLGAMRATTEGLGAELGWSPKDARAAFKEIISAEMCEYDSKACFVGLPNFLRYNEPESPNVIRSWDKLLDKLPQCELKHLLILRAKDCANSKGESYARALPEVFREALPKPFQKSLLERSPNQGTRNKEQGTESKEQEAKNKSPSGRLSGEYTEDFEKFWELYPPLRKKAKIRAFEAWSKAIKVAEAQTIIEAAEAFAASPLGNCKFCPGPEPWLNQRRWEDDRRVWQRGDDSADRARDPRGNFAAAKQYLSSFGEEDGNEV